MWECLQAVSPHPVYISMFFQILPSLTCVYLVLHPYFRVRGSDAGGAEATERFCPRAEKAVQGDEGAGPETPPQDQRADQGAHGSRVRAAEPASAAALRPAEEPQTRR